VENKFGYTIPEAAKALGVGRSSIYKAVSAGLLDARKSGRRTIITAKSVLAYTAALPKAAIKKAKVA
jgi:excisionase family DNA binding protein